MTSRLSDHADWLLLLKEFQRLYSQGSAGGSGVIQRHRRQVADALAAAVVGNPTMIDRPAVAMPVVNHLADAIDLGRRTAMVGISDALARVKHELTWEYGYESVPDALARNYAYTEVLGPRGPVPADDLILGFVLFAPDTVYPQHSHRQIEESYVTVAGEWSQNDAGVYMPGTFVFNPAGYEHRITTGSTEPCLLAWAWTGPAERLATPGMKFTDTGRDAPGPVPG